MTAQQQEQARGETAAGAATRPPPWRDERILRIVAQVVFLVAVLGVGWYLYSNLVANMRARGLRTDFGFLAQTAGFPLGGTDFSPRDDIATALRVGLRNTIVVSVWGIVLATVLGGVVGVARLSTNWLVRKMAAAFVEALRNIPLLVLLFWLYIAVLQTLPRISDAVELRGLVVLSNRGVYVPWIDVAEGAQTFIGAFVAALVVAAAVALWRTRVHEQTGAPHRRFLWGVGVFLGIVVLAWAALGQPVTGSLPVRDNRIVEGGYDLSLEQAALLFGLVIYMAAFIAEIVRGSILAVPKGQTEAANALGLSGVQRLRYVILPQAMRIAIPPTGNEYINLAKNSALGIAIAYPELLRVTRIAIGQGQPAPQLVAIMAVSYLLLSITISILVNIVNRRLQKRGARDQRGPRVAPSGAA